MAKVTLNSPIKPSTVHSPTVHPQAQATPPAARAHISSVAHGVLAGISSYEAAKPPEQCPTAYGSMISSFLHQPSIYGKSIADLKKSGPLHSLLHQHVPDDNCCANFVSAALAKLNIIPASAHNDVAYGLGNELKGMKAFRVVPISQAQPGDIAVCRGAQDAGHISFVSKNVGGGSLQILGSNNPNGGMQYVLPETRHDIVYVLRAI